MTSAGPFGGAGVIEVDLEGYSQPRRPLVFAQVRDRLPRPVNKPPGLMGVFRTVLIFLLQAAFVNLRFSLLGC